MNHLVAQNKFFPEYVFNKGFTKHYICGVEVINNERWLFLDSLNEFLITIGETCLSFFHHTPFKWDIIKDEGSILTTVNVDIEVFERSFTVPFERDAVLRRLDLVPGNSFLSSFMRGSISGSLSNWAIYLNRQREIIIIAVDDDAYADFERLFYAKPWYRKYRYLRGKDSFFIGNDEADLFLKEYNPIF
jgi:hypothetical protein